MIAFLGYRPGMLFIEVPLVGLCGLDHTKKKKSQHLSSCQKSVRRSFVETLTFFRFPIKERAASAGFGFKSFWHISLFAIQCNLWQFWCNL